MSNFLGPLSPKKYFFRKLSVCLSAVEKSYERSDRSTWNIQAIVKQDPCEIFKGGNKALIAGK